LIYVAALFSLLCFAIGWHLFGVQSALHKATPTQPHSMFSIAGRVAGAAAVSLLPLSSFHSIGLARVSDVTQILATWPGVFLAFAVVTLSYVVTTRR
jgi:hypothetical protein